MSRSLFDLSQFLLKSIIDLSQFSILVTGQKFWFVYSRIPTVSLKSYQKSKARLFASLLMAVFIAV